MVMVGRGCMHYLHRFLGVKIVPLRCQIISLVSNYFDFHQLTCSQLGGGGGGDCHILTPSDSGFLFFHNWGMPLFDDAFCVHGRCPLAHTTPCENTPENNISTVALEDVFGAHIQLTCLLHFTSCSNLLPSAHNNACQYRDPEVSECLCLLISAELSHKESEEATILQSKELSLDQYRQKDFHQRKEDDKSKTHVALVWGRGNCC